LRYSTSIKAIQRTVTKSNHADSFDSQSSPVYQCIPTHNEVVIKHLSNNLVLI